MAKTITTLLILILVPIQGTGAEETGIPVFPGAEGFGTSTVAGRGGRVLKVTNLKNDGPGSLRAAVEAKGPRFVVFDVAGIIDLEDVILIESPFITIAGQTAPGDGITIKNSHLIIHSHDILIQHLRIRPGDKAYPAGDLNDALNMWDSKWQAANTVRQLKRLRKDTVYNVVIDHVSLSWGEDETVAIWKGTRDITLSNSIISEALHGARHAKSSHSAGILIGGLSERISFHHNLLAHNHFRNPNVQNAEYVDIRNNVIYDWGALATEVRNRLPNDFPVKVNLVANTYIRGQSTLKTSKPLQGIDNISNNPMLHVSDNVLPDEGHDDSLSDDRPKSPFYKLNLDPKLIRGRTFGEKMKHVKATFFSPKPFVVAKVTTSSASSAFKSVLEKSGATLPKRGAVDRRVVRQVETRTGKTIDSQDDVGGYPSIRESKRPSDYDSDNDGMADEWELANGLNPKSSSDANGDLDSDGYTNLEEFIHQVGD